MLMSEKYDLSQKTSVDFVNYIWPLFNKTKNYLQIKQRVIPIQPLKSKEHLIQLISHKLDMSTLYHLSKFIPDIMSDPNIDIQTKEIILQNTITHTSKFDVESINYSHFVDLDASHPKEKDMIEYISFSLIKDHLSNREIYFTDPKITMALYSHSTYKFYHNFIKKLNIIR